MDSSDQTGTVAGAPPRTADIPGPRAAEARDVRGDPLADLAAFPFV
jgi:hypothetical protein